jgi:subtilase family serine protease
MTANGGSTSFRNIPDVSLVADNVYVYYGNGRSAAFVGTSCSTPLWAGLTALINEQTTLAGRPPVGFVNPAIYVLGASAAYNSSFHDIASGNNTWSNSPNSFYAVAGYDLCTGWGTPGGQNLINALAGPPDSLRIAPAREFTVIGPVRLPV